MKRGGRWWPVGVPAICALSTCGLALGDAPGLAAPGASLTTHGSLDRIHNESVAQFRVGRLSAARGRFVDLADLGQRTKPLAHYALWMRRNELGLFGKGWDRTGGQMQDRVGLVVAPVPLLMARHCVRYTVPFGRAADADRAAAGTVVLPGADAGLSRTARLKP